jgi:hypothetical protein
MLEAFEIIAQIWVAIILVYGTMAVMLIVMRWAVRQISGNTKISDANDLKRPSLVVRMVVPGQVPKKRGEEDDTEHGRPEKPCCRRGSRIP